MTEVKKHSPFGASIAKRWINCPASIRLSKEAPPSKESAYAAEGTKAHEVLEALLKDPEHAMATEEKFRKSHGIQMVIHARGAFDEIMRRKPKTKFGKIVAEEKVSLEHIKEGMFGTLDCAIIEPFGRLTIVDYKYGAGIPVDPEDNPQMLFYALAVAHKYDFNFEDVSIVIIQPRADHDRGPIREWIVPIQRLFQFEKTLILAVKAAESIDAETRPGDWCRFCPASVLCPALSTKAMATAQIEFNDGAVKLPKPDSIPLEKAGEVLDALELIETWTKSFREYALNAAAQGKIKGWKAVQKRSIRKWVDIDEASEMALMEFGDKAFSNPELLSPAQLEKLGSHAKEFVAEYSSNVSSGLTLVPESDKRPAVNSALQDFSEQTP